MKTKAELITENNELKAELLKYSYLEQKFKYSQQLVEKLRTEKFELIRKSNLRVVECEKLKKEINVGNEIIKNQMKLLSSRKKSWFQRWLGI